MDSAERDTNVWWGTFHLAPDEAGRWLVGPATVWIYHGPREWRIHRRQEPDALIDAATVTVPVAAGEREAFTGDEGGFSLSRFSFHQTGDLVSIQPALADREIVVRPETPLYVLSGEAVTMYVSTPVWMRIAVGTPLKLLQEIPTYRPSDTWFGPSTREGEHCYASRTAGRLKLEDMPMRPHRAITPVIVHNAAVDALHLDRLKLPVQYLSLYRDAADYLWTQAVTLEREVGGDLAALKLGDEAPPEASEARLVSDARQHTRANLIVRTFGALLHRE